MKVGIQTAGIIDRFGYEEGFKLIHDTGFDCVDFGFDMFFINPTESYKEHATIFDKPVEEVLEFFRPYKEAADRYGVSIYQAHAPFATYTRLDPAANEYILETMDKCAAVCRMFDCKYLVVHPAFNAYNERMEYDDEWNLNIERYSRMIPALKKYNVIACLENMFTARGGKVYEAICSDMNEAAAYIDELNGIAGEKRFAFCYDTGHGLLLGRDPYGSLLQIGDRVEALHIHDNNGVDDQHITAYMGKLDWNRFIRGMKAIHYQGALCFESSNTARVFDPELTPEVLRLTSATGRMFARRITEE